MPSEPAFKRAIASIGQNLFHAARESFGYPYPSYDVSALATAVRQVQGWALSQTRFYIGIRDSVP